jgi:hypothetical protein
MIISHQKLLTFSSQIIGCLWTIISEFILKKKEFLEVDLGATYDNVHMRWAIIKKYVS